MLNLSNKKYSKYVLCTVYCNIIGIIIIYIK